MNQLKVYNSTFEKIGRYISDMHTENPKLSIQRYSMVEKTVDGSWSSSDFLFDGQFFTRSKKKGGNLPSSWSISGTGLSSKELADKKHQEGFKQFMSGMFNFIQSDAVVAPMIIGADDIKRISVRLQNDFK